MDYIIYNIRSTIMKNLILAFTIILASVSVTTTQADMFGGGNNGEWKMGPNGPYWDESDWPEWTPMYWMEEFMDEWDNNDWGGGNNWGGNNYGGGYGMPYGGGYPQAPYGSMPYGNYGYPSMPAVPAPPAVR